MVFENTPGGKKMKSLAECMEYLNAKNIIDFTNMQDIEYVMVLLKRPPSSRNNA